MNLDRLLEQNRTIRAIGFDDAPFERRSPLPVSVAGVVCAGTRFEGMLWGQIEPNGWNATDTLSQMLLSSKFLPQLHVVLLDGISMGGFNMINLPILAERLQRPCITVMRRFPNLTRMEYAIRRLPDAEQRLDILRQGGIIHHSPPFYFQAMGVDAAIASHVLHRLTDCGHVPEALRIAHLITSAVVKGQSGRQA